MAIDAFLLNFYLAGLYITMFLWKVRFIALTVLFISSLAQAADPSQNWKTLVSEHFLIHHLADYSIQAKRSALIAEKIYPQLQKKFSWAPVDKISIVISDESDLANGSATYFPFNLMILRLSPPDTIGQLEDYDDWLSLLIEHELVHIFHTDKSRGVITGLRKVFGRHVLLFPNGLQPAWFLEGLATYIETHEGIGRGQSSSFEMMMREEVSKGLLPVSRVNLPEQSHPLNRRYLYGVYFYQFLQESYGEESIFRLVENYSNNLWPFAINSNTKSVYGKNITTLWQEFSVYLEKRFSHQMNELNKSELKQGGVVVVSPNKLTSLSFLSDGSLVYVADDYESPGRLVKITDQKKIILTEAHKVSDLDVGKDDQVYFSQIDVCGEYYLFFDLYRYDIKSGNLKKLTDCQRYKYFSVSKESNKIAAVRTIHSVPRIDLLDGDGVFLRILWQGKYGDVVNKIDWSEKRNKLLITKKELNKSWNIFEFDLQSDSWTEIVADEAVSMQARYSQNEESVLFTSDTTGVYNIYQYLFSDKSLTPVTNVMTGAFSPAQNLSNDLLYLNYERAGYVIHQTNLTEATVPVIKSLHKAEIRYREKLLETIPDYELRDYSPWADLKPRYWFPRFIIQEQGSEFGFTTSSNDSLHNHFYGLNIAYGYDQEELIGSVFYQYANWFGLLISKENELTSDSDTQETLSIRESKEWQVLFSLPFTKLESQWRISLGITGYENSDIYLADTIAGFPDSRDGVAGLSLSYDNRQSFLKSNSHETGRDVLLVTESSDAFTNNYSGQLTLLDWREFFRLGSHHTLALRAVAGAADATMRPYGLGGLSSDLDASMLLGPQSSRAVFNKRQFALRGYAANLQTGNNIEMASLEWRFPLSYVEKGFMAPPVAIMKHSARVFTEAGASWDDNQQKNTISSAGIEWLMETNIFYNLNLQLRFGYAKGLDDLGEDVFYLELGSAF